MLNSSLRRHYPFQVIRVLSQPMNTKVYQHPCLSYVSANLLLNFRLYKIFYKSLSSGGKAEFIASRLCAIKVLVLNPLSPGNIGLCIVSVILPGLTL